jgi:RNA polymerase sigma-70 factor (ECF subfamily)
MTRVAAGDAAAFAELFDLLWQRVCRRITFIVRDPAMSEEVTQDVFLELWQRAAQFDPRRGSAVGWVLTRAQARAIDRVRAVEAERAHDLTDYSRGLADAAAPAIELVETRIDNAYLGEAVRALSDLQREAVQLSYGMGLTHVELAEHLGVPLGTVKSRIHEALLHLREEMERRTDFAVAGSAGLAR